MTKKLRSIADIQPLYWLPREPLVAEVLIPAFKASSNVDCMVGFFSSRVLASLAPGLATFIEQSLGQFRLIISPMLSAEDLVAIEAGTQNLEAIAAKTLEKMVITEDTLEQHTLKCLSYLLRSRRLEIHIALMKNALFHPKVWLFQNGEDVLAVHGSSNMTHSGINNNFEQLSISKSWEDSNQYRSTQKLVEQFTRLWGNSDENCIVIPVPEAIKKELLAKYDSQTLPKEEDLNAIYDRANNHLVEASSYEESLSPRIDFSIPSHLIYEEGPFAHQGKAVDAWCKAGFRGVLEMATGSGKTITSMICAHRLYEQHSPLLIVVAAPYVPLIDQWCDEIAPFGLSPANLTSFSGVQSRTRELQRIKRRLRSGNSTTEAVVVSHKTLCTPDFFEAIQSFDCTKLLIADEVHNLGSVSFISNPPEFFEYRLGLSATPVRQYDEEGTDGLFAYFGQPVFKFTLKEAIGLCLVEYDYFVHEVNLSSEEMEDWSMLTAKIKENSWRGADGKQDDFLLKLRRDRRIILETAKGKLEILAELLSKETASSLKYTLIYATDKEPAQLVAVNGLLEKQGILFRQLTAEETGNREKTKRIIQAFQEGDIDVLTAKRVLDEGVNIPQIQKAYILASTTVERQWVQRRGRLLRTCREIGKEFSIIHDFVVFPPKTNENLDDDARSLAQSEFNRVEEFFNLARNAGRNDGPLDILDKLARLAFID